MIHKKILLLSFILFCKTLCLQAQNLLSPEYRICFGKMDILKQPSSQKDWKTVTLLSSWERQGYSSMDADCCLQNDFKLSATQASKGLTLRTGLQCDIQAIYINGHLVAEKISNQFWSDRDKTFSFSISPDICIVGKNQIDIYANNLSYTGGISHNSCSLSAIHTTSPSEISIQMPEKNHIITGSKNTITLHYKTPKNGTINFVVKNDFHQPIFSKTFAVKSNSTSLKISLEKTITKPGFYECFATLKNDGYTATTEWMGINPEKIKCHSDTIAGFSNFWKETLKDLQKTPPNFTIQKDEKLCTPKRTGYIVEMQSLGGLTIKGYYFVPNGVTNAPAILHLPGYSYGFENLNEFLTRDESLIELALCVRSHGLSKEFFDADKEGPGIWGYKMYSPTENAYRGIYMDCVRAIEFLHSRPEVDKSKIGVMGGSQGGGLAIVTAGLCSDKVAACAYFDPFPSDVRDFVQLRTVCQTEIKNFMGYYKNYYSVEEAMHTQDLLNVKGFAHWIKCPTYFITSLFDDDCPSHVGFAVYNNIKGEKKYNIYPNQGHACEEKYLPEFMAYFKNRFWYLKKAKKDELL